MDAMISASSAEESMVSCVCVASIERANITRETTAMAPRTVLKSRVRVYAPPIPLNKTFLTSGTC